MKNNLHKVVSYGLLSVLLAVLVLGLTGCNFFQKSPTAKFTITQATPDGNVIVGEELTFDGGNSTAPGNKNIIKYEWTFGDGNSATGETATHSYDSTGTYTVTLTVTADGGANNSTSKNVTVNEQPELDASFTMDPEPGVVNQAVTFDASASTGDISTYEWSFGDGDSQAGANLQTIDHVYTQTGSYTVQLTVRDGEGDLSIEGELLKVQTSSSTT